MVICDRTHGRSQLTVFFFIPICGVKLFFTPCDCTQHAQSSTENPPMHAKHEENGYHHHHPHFPFSSRSPIGRVQKLHCKKIFTPLMFSTWR